MAAQTEMQMSGHSGSTGHWQKDPRKEGASATGLGLEVQMQCWGGLASIVFVEKVVGNQPREKIWGWEKDAV